MAMVRLPLRDKIITMAHGGGGRAMRELIERLIVPAFANHLLAPLEDQARIDLHGLGDIGKLAICGTVNDLAMAGAVPLFLSCGLIIEEGFATADLERVLASMSATARQAGVQVVTGDTKVVNRGAADRLFINTAGIGMVATGVNVGATRARPGDVIIVNGTLGDHGVAILVALNEL